MDDLQCDDCGKNGIDDDGHADHCPAYMEQLEGLITQSLEAAFLQCEASGIEPSADLSPEDCEWIIGRLDRLPSKEEWATAGYHSVGDAHCAE